MSEAESKIKLPLAWSDESRDTGCVSVDGTIEIRRWEDGHAAYARVRTTPQVRAKITEAFRQIDGLTADANPDYQSIWRPDAKPMQALLDANRRANSGPLRNAVTHSGARLLTALDEMGWELRPRQDTAPTGEERCARDSDWCDGDVCRENGVYCSRQNPAPTAPTGDEELQGHHTDQVEAVARGVWEDGFGHPRCKWEDATDEERGRYRFEALVALRHARDWSEPPEVTHDPPAEAWEKLYYEERERAEKLTASMPNAWSAIWKYIDDDVDNRSLAECIRQIGERLEEAEARAKKAESILKGMENQAEMWEGTAKSWRERWGALFTRQATPASSTENARSRESAEPVQITWREIAEECRAMGRAEQAGPVRVTEGDGSRLIDSDGTVYEMHRVHPKVCDPIQELGAAAAYEAVYPHSRWHNAEPEHEERFRRIADACLAAALGKGQN